MGEKKNKYNIDDYVLASLDLYLDFLNLLLAILRIFSNNNWFI